MDRREIDDVEAQRRDLRQPRDAVVERAVLARHRALAARDHLVPGAATRPRAVGNHRHRNAPDQVGAGEVHRRGLRKFVREELCHASGLIELALRAVDDLPGLRVIELQFVEQLAALARLERDVEAGVELELDAAEPACVVVGPGLDAEQVAAGLGRREGAMPAVVVVQRHRLAAPFVVAFLAPEQRRGEPVVAFAQQVGPHVDPLAGDAFHRIAAAVDAREDILDEKTRPGGIVRRRTRGGC